MDTFQSLLSPISSPLNYDRAKPTSFITEGLLRLCTRNKGEKKNVNATAVTLSLLQSPLSPYHFSFLMTISCVTPKKEGESRVVFAVRLPFSEHQDDY
jgi:hypothetical protein